MSDQPGLFRTEELPLVARTELRDVLLVAIEGSNPFTGNEVPNVIQVKMEDAAYQAEAGILRVRVQTEVTFDLPRREESSDEGEGREEAPANERAFLNVTHEAVMSLQGDHDAITSEQAHDFIVGTVLFLVFPYVRQALHHYAADLRLPNLVLPFLKRPRVPGDSR